MTTTLLRAVDTARLDPHTFPPAAGGPRCPVLLTSHWCRYDQLIVAAFGPEQTGITLALTDRVARFDGLNITAMTTNRIGDIAAGTYAVLTDLAGRPEHLSEFRQHLVDEPVLEPRGEQIVAAGTGDLEIIAPDRPKLIRDVTQIVSRKFRINIETLVNRTYRDMFAAFEVLNLSDPTDGPRWGGCEGVVSVTRMKLELPAGTNAGEFTAALNALGKGWVIHWKPRPAGGLAAGAFDGSLN